MAINYSPENRDLIKKGIDSTLSIQMDMIKGMKEKGDLFKIVGDDTQMNPQLQNQMVTFLRNMASLPDNDLVAYFESNNAEWSVYCTLSAECSRLNDDLLMRLIKVEKPPEYLVAAEALKAFIECKPFTYQGKTYNYCLKTELDKYLKSQGQR